MQIIGPHVQKCSLIIYDDKESPGTWLVENSKSHFISDLDLRFRPSV